MPNQTVFNLSIHFGRFVTPIDPQPDEFDFVTVRYGSSYGFIGITTNDSSGEQYLTNSLREAVEAALGDYLKINFDL